MILLPKAGVLLTKIISFLGHNEDDREDDPKNNIFSTTSHKDKALGKYRDNLVGFSPKYQLVGSQDWKIWLNSSSLSSEH